MVKLKNLIHNEFNKNKIYLTPTLAGSDKSSFENDFFFDDKEFFSSILILKMDVKMNLRIIIKNNPADPEIGFLPKSISKPNGCATAIPTALKLRPYFDVSFISEFAG